MTDLEKNLLLLLTTKEPDDVDLDAKIIQFKSKDFTFCVSTFTKGGVEHLEVWVSGELGQSLHTAAFRSAELLAAFESAYDSAANPKSDGGSESAIFSAIVQLLAS